MRTQGHNYMRYADLWLGGSKNFAPIVFTNGPFYIPPPPQPQNRVFACKMSFYKQRHGKISIWGVSSAPPPSCVRAWKNNPSIQYKLFFSNSGKIWHFHVECNYCLIPVFPLYVPCVFLTSLFFKLRNADMI